MKKIGYIFILVIFAVILFANVSFAEENDPEALGIHQADTAEKVFTMYFLRIGDFAAKFLSKTFGEQLTIDKIVFNETNKLNANFFTKSVNSSSSDVSTKIREFVNKWYSYFKKLTIVVILIGLIGAGIKMLMNTAQAKASAYDSFVKIVMAICLIFFFPYVMRMAFDINEGIIKYIKTSSFIPAETPFAVFPEEVDVEDIIGEESDPAYYQIENSDEDSIDYVELKANYFTRNLDVMRLIRAFAGVTYRFVYVIVWLIMLVQLYVLAFIYLKRYIMLAFLITVYPLVVIGYVIDGMTGKRKTTFNNWCKKFFSLVLLQTLHAVMYGIIGRILVSQILNSPSGEIGTQKINMILVIIATSFLFSGEKMLHRFWKNSIDSSGEIQGIKGMFGAGKRIAGFFRGK